MSLPRGLSPIYITELLAYPDCSLAKSKRMGAEFMNGEKPTGRKANNWLDWGPPLRLLAEANGPWPERLEEIAQRIDQLPVAFQESLSDYLEPVYIDELRRAARALRKLREDQ